jgi:hypothetical protein
MLKVKTRRFSLISLLTALTIIGIFEISLTHAEKLFWLKLGM